MREISYLDAMCATTERMADGGVFLSVAGDVPNTMTIGWGSVGVIWGKPVFTVMLRPQRHSYDMLLRAGEFSVSVPGEARPLRRELAFAGSRSGREVNKFDGHGLTAAPAQIIGAPIVRECALHFECRTLLTQDMTPERMSPEIIARAYPGGDFHTLFFGEILRCYETDEP